MVARGKDGEKGNHRDSGLVQRMKGTSPSRGCGRVVANGIKSAKMENIVFIQTTKGESHDYYHDWN